MPSDEQVLQEGQASAHRARRGEATAENPVGRRGLVEIVRDFIAVHQQLASLFEGFQAGTLRFDEVGSLIADSESSSLFRLKERVHALFRGEADGQPFGPDDAFRRGEALFDLAVGSLFHEALKFRENFYQLEVYAPRVLSLRDGIGGEPDELLQEFEKILRGASDRVEESLDEAGTLLDQLRRQLLVLLVDSREEKSAGLVARYLIAHREDVELVYPEGLAVLLGRIHGDVLSAYLTAIRSQLESARFEEAVSLIDEALEVAASNGGAAAEVVSDLGALDAYALGMHAFLNAAYLTCAEKLSDWLDLERHPLSSQVDFALAASSRITELVDPGEQDAAIALAAKLTDRLRALDPA